MKAVAFSTLVSLLVFSCNLDKPKNMEVTMPKQAQDTLQTTKVNAKQAITLLLNGNKEGNVFYYEGAFDSATAITACPADSFRAYAMRRNAAIIGDMEALRAKCKTAEITGDAFKQQEEKICARYEDDAPFFLVKWGGDASYGDVIGLLDVLKSCDVTNYSLSPVTPEELDALKNAKMK